MSDEELEIHSIKWNVARIARLSTGRFALLTHYSGGALDIIKVGTLEEIADHIPTAEQCVDTPRVEKECCRAPIKKSYLDLADLGL